MSHINAPFNDYTYQEQSNPYEKEKNDQNINGLNLGQFNWVTGNIQDNRMAHANEFQ